MKLLKWQLDLRSMFVGFVLTALVVILSNGFSSRAGEPFRAIAADENGIYIMNENFVRYFEREKCVKQPGCHFYTR